MIKFADRLVVLGEYLVSAFSPPIRGSWSCHSIERSSHRSLLAEVGYYDQAVTDPENHIQATRNGWLVDCDIDRHDPAAVATALNLASATIAAKGGGRAEFWIYSVTESDDAGPEQAGFKPYRDLFQLRMPLPAAASTLSTRPFSSADSAAFLEVNNRAFAWHPEQGGMTQRDLDAKRGKDWFDPSGFLLYEVADQLAGFCWTRVHHDEDPSVGEIYAIAIDPAFHGQGLGAPMTLAGLDQLFTAGLEVAMLYVESDNAAANATYERIGFKRHMINRAYQREIAAV